MCASSDSRLICPQPRMIMKPGPPYPPTSNTLQILHMCPELHIYIYNIVGNIIGISGYQQDQPQVEGLVIIGWQRTNAAPAPRIATRGPDPRGRLPGL